MVLPCSSDSLCGFGEALEGMVSFQEDDDAFHPVEKAIQYEANIPTLESVSMTSAKNSSDRLCQQIAIDETSSASTQEVSPPHSPPGGYQKRGRFLIWPVTMEPPTVGISLPPFFGMTPQ